MRAIVTCGPAYEPIDRVRRITNFSTGEIGVLLANRLARAGHCVTCFKGEGATTSLALETGCVCFATNDELLERLRAIEKREDVAGVFHAAALCDFKVAAVTGGSGAAVGLAKISSREGEILVRLVPAAKLIANLR